MSLQVAHCWIVSKVDHLPEKGQKSALEMELMHRIKDAIDPLGLLNPGKVL